MFEVVVTLCLLSNPDICRAALVPGVAAETLPACRALLADADFETLAWPAEVFAGVPRCTASGPVAQFDEVAPGLFVHRGMISDADPMNAGDVANVGFIIGARAVAVIDSGGSRKTGEAIYRAVRSQTALPIDYVILTHMHPDHALGASVFVQAGAEVVGHAGLPRALQDRQDSYLNSFGARIGFPAFLGTAVVLPDLVVDDVLELDLGDRRLALQAWPNAHSSSDLTAGDPLTGILFTGDLMFHDHAPSLDGSVLGWRATLTRLQAMPYTRIVPGHGGPLLDWPQGAAGLAAYLETLIADTRAAIAQGLPLRDAVAMVAQSQAGAWQLFDLFNPRNATVAYTELEWE
ncbi:quinoprotein relay system zinc metallohydrolase 2 [Loktanella agnita]|uniref:quinoprotein relay system zinc metallohydrolase 2 n=1 Tax=Loktanella agnita TaxID=287097 RepID=UPI003987560E